MSYYENDRRGQRRKELDLEVLVSILPEGSGFRRVKLLNLSEDGIAIRAVVPALEESSRLVVLIPDPVEPDVFREVRGTVVFSDPDQVGLHFDSFTAQSMSAVMSLLGSD